MPKLKEYMKKLTIRKWEDLIVKAKYVRGISAKRAGVALDMANEDGKDLLLEVKKHMPKTVEDYNLVEILFNIIANMVDEGHLILDVDPKVTSETAEQSMKELIELLQNSGEVGNQDITSDETANRSCEQGFTASGYKLQQKTEDDFIADLTGSGLLKSSSYMVKKYDSVRYQVCNEIVEGRDLKTLQGSNWLNDKVINSYMALMKQEQNMNDSEHIYVIPSYMAVLWENNRFDTSFYTRVQFSRYSWIFMPINKNGNHWILLAANVLEQSISILDSLGGRNEKYQNYWRKYMNMKEREAKVKDLTGDWKRGTLSSSRQKDGHSCGPFVLMNALALTRGLVPTILTQKYALVIRHYVTARIVEAAKKPGAQRTVCDMLECKKPPRATWIQCEVCGR